MKNRALKKTIKIVQRKLHSIGLEVRKVKKVQAPLDVKRMRKLLYLGRIFDRISSVEGDIVECGIGKGISFLCLVFLASKEGKERKLWGFDSFKGFPRPTVEDTSPRNPKKGELGGVTREDVLNLLMGAGIDEKFVNNKIKIIKGFFERTLKLYRGDSIALLHIDADLYQSYKQVLEELFPKVARGGVVLFDEYNHPDWPGATRAVNNYFQKSDYKILYDKIADKYYIIK